jgi:hypothetical protein
MTSPCPYCGAEFPNSPKVPDSDSEGWWWKCYTKVCVVEYYQPERRVAILRGTGETISYDELFLLRGEKGRSG